MKISLSVIVPVFNVENFLPRCIDSIRNQTFRDIEIILVNDGSTDSSPQICDDYASKDTRIKVIHQQNAGVSVARNNGITLASGQYLTFVDSDDWVAAEMYETMYAVTQTQQGPDVIMCDFINIKENANQNISTQIRSGFYSKTEIIKELYPTLLVTEDLGRIPIVSACSCLFNSEWFKKNQIRFDAQLKYSEDYLFMAKVMLHASSFYYLKEHYFYNYLQYDASRSKKFQPEWWSNLLYLNAELKKLLSSQDTYNFTRHLNLQLLHSALVVLGKIADNQYLDFPTKIREIKTIVNDKQLIAALSNLQLKTANRGFILVVFFIKKRWAMAYYFYVQLIKTIKSV